MPLSLNGEGQARAEKKRRDREHPFSFTVNLDRSCWSVYQVRKPIEGRYLLFSIGHIRNITSSIPSVLYFFESKRRPIGLGGYLSCC